MTDDSRAPLALADKQVTRKPGDAVLEPARRATMTEVALAAGVSQTTVSLVLNDVRSARFSAETRTRVLEAARRLDYQVVRRRPAPAPGAVGAIAFVVDEISTDPA